jgi:hypothetical protein
MALSSPQLLRPNNYLFYEEDQQGIAGLSCVSHPTLAYVWTELAQSVVVSTRKLIQEGIARGQQQMAPANRPKYEELVDPSSGEKYQACKSFRSILLLPEDNSILVAAWMGNDDFHTVLMLNTAHADFAMASSSSEPPTAVEIYLSPQPSSVLELVRTYCRRVLKYPDDSATYSWKTVSRKDLAYDVWRIVLETVVSCKCFMQIFVRCANVAMCEILAVTLTLLLFFSLIIVRALKRSLSTVLVTPTLLGSISPDTTVTDNSQEQQQSTQNTCSNCKETQLLSKPPSPIEDLPTAENATAAVHDSNSPQLDAFNWQTPLSPRPSATDYHSTSSQLSTAPLTSDTSDSATYTTHDSAADNDYTLLNRTKKKSPKHLRKSGI